MKKGVVSRFLCVLLLVTGVTGIMHASAITGSLPIAGIGISNSGGFGPFGPSPTLTAAASVSSGTGTGSFSVVPLLTIFSGFAFDVANISSGGGFTISNATFGSFVATEGMIVTSLPTFLNVDLRGVYTAGPGLQPQGSYLVNLNLSFTQNGGSLSASGTLASLPEVNTLFLVGTGILGIATRMRYMQNREPR